MQTLAECAYKRTPYVRKIVVDFVREAMTVPKRNVMLQIKYVELDEVVARYDCGRDKLPPVTRELTRSKTDFVLNNKPLMEPIIPTKEPPQ